MNPLLLISFCLNAALSAFVGLGGGTLYLVLLDLFRTDYRAIPFIALACNIGVSAVSAAFRLWRGQRERLVLLTSIFVPSMLSTYAGAQLVFAEENFRLLLSSVVLCILVFSLLSKKIHSKRLTGMSRRRKIHILMLVSFGIGLLSGIIGIGGGIILGPVLYILGMSYLDIPLITALYIFVNSIVGIISQSMKYARIHGDLSVPVTAILSYWPLILVCVIAGIVSLFVYKRIRHEKVIKNSVLSIIVLLAVVNFFRSGIL